MPQEEQSKTKYSYLNLWKYPRETIRYYTDKPFSPFMILLLSLLPLSNSYFFIYEKIFQGHIISGMAYIVIGLYFIWLYLIGKAFKGVATYKEVFSFILLQNLAAILVYIVFIVLMLIFFLISKKLDLDNSVLFTIMGFLLLSCIFILGRISTLMYAEVEKISLNKSIFITIVIPMIFIIIFTGYKIMARRAEVLSCGDTMTYSQSLRHRMTSQKQEHLLEKFTEIYAPYEVPTSLRELIKFEEKHGPDSYVISFFLRPEKKEEFFDYTFSTDETNNNKVAKYFLPLANIDGTGATVAFWIKDINITDLENAPLIELGSEGQIDIVAKNMKDFLYMLSFGLEPMDGEYSQFVNDSNGETYYRRESFKAYRRWLKNIMKIEPVLEKELKVWGTPKKIEALHKEAKTLYSKIFFKWLYTLIPDPKVEKAKYEAEQFLKLSKEKRHLEEQLEQNKTIQLYMLLAKNARLLRYIDKAEYKDEKNYYLKALNLDTNNTKVMFKLAKLVDDKEALSYYKQIETLEKHPEKTPLYYNLAMKYEYLDDDNRALKYYKKHIALNPRPNNYGDSDILELCKKLNIDPIVLYEKSVKIAPNQLNYETLYDLYKENEDYNNAFFTLQRLFKIKKLKDFEYAVWGGEFKESKEYEKALVVWKEGVKQFDSYKEKAYLHTKIAEVYKKLHNKEKTKEYQDLAIVFYKKHIKSLVDDNDNKAKFYEKISTIYQEQKKYRDVVMYLKQAVLFEKDNNTLSEHYYYIAEAYKKFDKHIKALEYAKRSLKLMPNDESSIKQVEEMQNEVQ